MKPLKTFLRGILYALRYPHGVQVAEKCKISHRATLSLYGGGGIRLGRNVRVWDHAMLMSYGGHIEIGNNCTINPFCVLYGHGGLKIGNGVRIAAHTVIIPGNHTYARLDIPIWQQPETRLGIEIGDDVWIGTGVRILDGVKIGEGCVIGAGAVVTKSLPNHSIAIGVPAKVVASRLKS